MGFKSYLAAVLVLTFFSGVMAVPSFALSEGESLPNQNHIEFEYAHAALTSGYAAWNDVNILNYFGYSPKHQFVLETDYKNHFGESAAVIGFTYTHVYNSLWYQDFSASFSTNSAILPGFVIYSELHRKLLPNEALVVGLGVGHNVSKDPYSDTYGLGEFVYYFGGPVSIQGGMRLNGSSPGSVITTRVFGSLNFVYDRWDAYVRYETGREGYSVVGENTFKNEFESHDEAVQIHYWLKSNMGFGAKLDLFQSVYYNRNQVSLDLMFKY